MKGNEMLKDRVVKLLAKSEITIPEAARKSQKYKEGSFSFKSLYRWINGERKPNIVSLRVLEKITKCKKGYLTNLVIK